jgi:hypothetical protein
MVMKQDEAIQQGTPAVPGDLYRRSFFKDEGQAKNARDGSARKFADHAQAVSMAS